MDSDKMCKDSIVSYQKYPKYRTTYYADLPKLAKPLWILLLEKDLLGFCSPCNFPFLPRHIESEIDQFMERVQLYTMISKEKI